MFEMKSECLNFEDNCLKFEDYSLNLIHPFFEFRRLTFKLRINFAF